MDNPRFHYEDILHRSRPASPARAKMSMVERAAQFAPFAALTGYDATIAETARLTGQRIELDESEKASLNRTLQLLAHISSPTVTVTHYVVDLRKEGGAYITETIRLKKTDPYTQTLIPESGTPILLDNILKLHCDLLPDIFLTENPDTEDFF